MRQSLAITIVFFIVSAWGIYHHELWLDEAQHFLIARDSESLRSLYFNMQYDGHVRLWNYLLYFITHYISDNEIRCDKSIFRFKELICFNKGIINPDYFIYSVTRK
jgi:hypothetical protein